MTDIQFPERLKHCPYHKSISFIGDKWTLSIIKELYLNKKNLRFNELLKALKPISSKTLAKRLKDLVNFGIIARNVTPSTPVLIDYSLTEKGADLNNVLDEMAKWMIKWYEKELTGEVENPIFSNI